MGWVTWLIIGVMVAVMVVFMVLSSQKRKKQEEEANKLIDAVKPGNKVKTIGGICGIVVEVDPEERTFVLETGSETSGKCFIKFDRQAIYQTDAVIEPVEEKTDTETGVKTEETAEASELTEENISKE